MYENKVDAKLDKAKLFSGNLLYFFCSTLWPKMGVELIFVVHKLIKQSPVCMGGWGRGEDWGAGHDLMVNY